MSEVSSTDLVENITMEVDDADVVPAPIDPTLTHSGQAADAKAVGDALAAISSVKKVNGQSPNSSGEVTVLATQIPMSSATGAQTVSEAILSSQDKTGETIKYSSTSTETIKEVVDEIVEACTDGVSNEDIDGIFEDWSDEE